MEDARRGRAGDRHRGSRRGGRTGIGQELVEVEDLSRGKITAYVYIQDRADVNGCGDFTTRASATTKLSYITNYVDWDPIGIGATASIKGAGTSVAGNNSASPSAKVTNRNAKSAGISGVVCMSWTTIYLGMFSTAETKVKGTLYPISTHV